MPPINSVRYFVKALAKMEKSVPAATSEASQMVKFVKDISSGYGRELSPHVYEGKFLDELPDFLKSMIRGLKHPKVTVNAKSPNKGSGILGFVVKDGGRTVNASALAVDCTKNTPVFQLRSIAKKGSQKAVSINTLFDTNASAQNALRSETFVDKKLAKEMNVSEHFVEFAKALSKPEISTSAMNTQLNVFRQLWANKGIKIVSIDECMPEFVRIAQQTGKVTEQSAKNALNTVLKSMGHDPNCVKLNFMPITETMNAGCFNNLTGELSLNVNKFTSHQDLASVLGHELTHMEDFVMLYKQVGAEKFAKLVGADFNKAWYDKMSKRIVESHFANEMKGKITAVCLDDGVKITDPKEIKALLAPERKHFGIKEMSKELTSTKSEMNFDDMYGNFKSKCDYVASPIEKHARSVEMGILDKIEKSGNYINSEMSNASRNIENMAYYDRKMQGFIDSFNQIDNALKKAGFYGVKRSHEFNKLYSQTFKEIDSELEKLESLLSKKLKKGMPSEEYQELSKKIDDIIAQRHGVDLELRNEILQSMQKKLGLPTIPSRHELYLQAVNKIDPEIGKIKIMLSNGLPKEEFTALSAKCDALIKERYKYSDMFNAKIEAEIDNMRKNLLG